MPTIGEPPLPSAARIGQSRPASRLMLAVALALAACRTSPACAADWRWDDVQVRIDTTLSAATIFGVQKLDPGIIGVANGGRLPTLNLDDGNLNYRRRGLVAAPFSGLSEFEVVRGGFGVLVAGSYWFDPRNAWRNSTDRTPLSDGALDQVARGGRLLNAYAYGQLQPGGLPLDFKVGAVALNWGEASLTANGISVVSPFDLTRLHTPGAAIRDALLPVPMANVTARLAPGLSLEGFVEAGKARTLFDPAGTFFSVTDLVGGGARDLIIGSTPPITDLPPYVPGTAIPHGPDRDPQRAFQYGLALRWTPERLAGTELSLYWLQYDSRLPTISLGTGRVSPLAVGSPTLIAASYASSSSYFSEYPGRIRLAGASISTRLPGDLTLRAEGSWRFGQPLQVDFSELGLAGLSPLNSVFALSQVGGYGFNQIIQGWRRHDVGTIIASLSRAIPDVFGSDQLTLLYEAGVTTVPDLPGQDRLRYSGSGSYTSGNPFFTQIGVQPYTTTKGFATRVSGGHRLTAQLDYYNAIGSVTVSPRLAYAHDIAGITPLPLGTYVRGRQAVSVGVAATWLSRWSAGLEYVNYFGAGSANLLRDRDYVATYLKASF